MISARDLRSRKNMHPQYRSCSRTPSFQTRVSYFRQINLINIHPYSHLIFTHIIISYIFHSFKLDSGQIKFGGEQLGIPISWHKLHFNPAQGWCSPEGGCRPADWGVDGFCRKVPDSGNAGIWRCRRVHPASCEKWKTWWWLPVASEPPMKVDQWETLPGEKSKMERSKLLVVYQKCDEPVCAQNRSRHITHKNSGKKYKI